MLKALGQCKLVSRILHLALEEALLSHCGFCGPTMLGDI